VCWAFGSTVAALLLTALGVLNPAHRQRRDGPLFYTNPQQTFLSITRATAQILEAGAIPVVLGGDHAVSYGVVRAYEDPVCVVHFDAHLD
jgi:arginase family enzyme